MAQNYQHGGWYEGRQWNAENQSFGAKGQENVGANAGKFVSAEVNAQSAAAQGKSTQEFNNYLSGGSGNSGNSSGFSGANLITPTTSSEVTQYLKNFQDVMQGAKEVLNAPVKSNDQILQEIRTQITPTQPMPTATNMVDLFKSLTTDAGITGLENMMRGLKEQEMLLADSLQQQQQTEEGKPVPLNVIAGRQTEEQRQAQVQMNTILRRKALVQDELTSKYSMVNAIMQFTQQDYQNAVQNYELEFKQNLAVYEAFTSEVRYQDEVKRDAAKTLLDASTQLIEWEREDARAAQAMASANLTVYANLLQSGSIDYNSLSGDQRLQINKMEVQAGLGVGFLSAIRSENANGKLLYAGSNGAVFQMPDGSLKTSNYNVSGKSGSSGGDYTKAELQGAVSSSISSIANSYGHVSPAAWNDLMNEYVREGGNKKDFISNYSQYTDPNRGDFNKAYGFDRKTR